MKTAFFPQNRRGIGGARLAVAAALLSLAVVTGVRFFRFSPMDAGASVPRAALVARGSLSLSNDFHVHWGPIVVDGDLDVSTRPSLTGWPQNNLVSYPQKYSRGALAPWDISPAPPNSDGRRYWAYRDGPPTPALDVEYYRVRAAATRWPLRSAPSTPSLVWSGGEVLSGAGLGVASPTGSGYFSSSLNPGALVFSHFQRRDPGAVVFVEAKDRERYATGLDAAFLDVEALVLYGARHDVWMSGSSVVFGATIPSRARDEYRDSGAAEVWEMENPPPARGGPSFAAVGEGRCCYPVPGVNLHGLLYAGGRLLGSGGAPGTVVGLTVLGGDNGRKEWRNVTLYADDGVVNGVRWRSKGPPPGN